MSQPIQAEELAALIEGRLDRLERASLMARLAKSDDYLETLGESAAILRELQLLERDIGVADRGDLAR